MILRALELTHFRRHVERVRVEFHERFSVVHGANEAGKSTVFAALEYAFFRRANASGTDVERIVPWSATGLHPTLAVEFAHAGAEYRLEKIFRGVGGASLVKRRSAAGAFEAWKGDEADEFAAALFDGELGRFGATGFKPTHRGIAHFLFAPQGRLAIRGDERELALGPDADARLNRLVGAAGQSPAEAKLVDAIDRAYTRLYLKNGALAKAAASTALGRDLDAADAQIAAVERSLAAYGEAAVAAEHARDAARALGARHRAAAGEAAAEQPRLVAALAAHGRMVTADAVLREAASAYERAADRERILAEAAASLAELEPRLVAASAARAAAETAAAATAAARDMRRSEANAANAPDERAAELGRRHAAALRRAEYAAEHASLDRRRARVASLAERRAALAAERAAIVAPSAAELDAVRDLVARRTAVAQKLALGRTRVRIVPERAGSLSVTTAAGTVAVAATSGASLEYAVDGTLVLAVAGVGTVEIAAPVRDEAKDARELASLEQRLAAAVAAYGSSDVALLAALARDADDAAKRLAAVTLELGHELGGDDRATLDARAAALGALLAAPAEDAAELALAIDAAEREGAARRKRATDAATAADVAHDAATAELRAADAARAALELRAAPARAIAVGNAGEAAPERRAATLAAYAARDAATIERDAARTAYEPYRDVADPAARAETLRRESDDLARMLGEARQAEARAEERARHFAGEGLSHALAEALERRAAIRRELDAAVTTERATKLLRDLALELETDRAASFARPVLEFVGPRYARLTGRTIVSLDLGATHGMNGIGLEGARRAVDWLELSGGAADQLALLIRLGYAHLLSAPDQLGRIPVLLDDPLVNADDARRRKMLEIFDEISERVQIVAFTCRQSDYAGSTADYATIRPHP